MCTQIHAQVRSLPIFVCHLSIYSSLSFGIFRLTDPPGIQTILGCHAKEAFHPHTDLPIYTVRLFILRHIPIWHSCIRIVKDADKGHVQMKDMPLEIVDLR